MNITIKKLVLKVDVSELIKRSMEIMATLTEILDVVQVTKTRVDSLDVLVDGIRQQLADILAGVLPPAVQAQVDKVFTDLTSNLAKVDEMITENTPAPPVDPPPDTV